jgi:excisionase family DNA binding protein
MMPATNAKRLFVPPPEPAVNRENLLTPEEVKDWLKLSVDAIRKKVQRGQLPAIRLDGRNLRFRPSDIQRWLDEHSIDASMGI